MKRNVYGLTAEEVEERIAQGKVNGKHDLQTKSIRKIIFDNVFTLFNGLNLVLAMLILVMSKGQNWRNTLFMGIVFFNLFVGIFQEIKAKKTIEKLSLISAPKVNVLRNGEEKVITVEEIVTDDCMILEAGRQICSDAVIEDGELEVNESMITGESDPIVKRAGEELLSGSFVVSGRAIARVTHVGVENYATKIASGARYIKKPNSEIMRSLRAIIRLMSIIVVPFGIALLLRQYLLVKDNINDAVLKMAGSIVSMIPQGLIALSTTVFAVGVVRLSTYKTLSQDLYSIETLARVDVLCLDKTGTITEGTMVVTDVVPEEGGCEEVLASLTEIVRALPDNNPTYEAVKAYVADRLSSKEVKEIFPFSSDRKWSGINVEEGGLVMGAPEFIAPEQAAVYKEKCEKYQQEGKRVICVARTATIAEHIIKDTHILGYVLIEDKIREEAPATLAYFAEQGVDIRVISGDNPVTVSAIAKKAGLKGAEKCVDASTWGEDVNLEEMLGKYVIFGRVKPEQKLALIRTLKKLGHTVAMTGDGVNDVLALKEADCSVAMASGSDVAKTVASLVLLDSNFASMPKIVSEGRRSINNLQRSASLYLVKTIYATMLAIIFLFIGSYPFEPSHLTLVGVTATGIPSFLLALEPNKERAEGNFIYNALRKALPGALTIVVGIVAIQIMSKIIPLQKTEADMLCVLMVALASFMVLFRVCLPLDIKHTVIFFSMLAVYMLGWLVMPGMFDMMAIGDLTWRMLCILLALAGCGAVIFVLFIMLERKLAARGKPKILEKLNLE